ncbi:MAG: histidinol-phosphate transaminase [Lachnospiraceae bacterium]
MKAWEKNVRRVTPYTPGEQPKESNIIKLNTNENPYPPAPLVLEKRFSVDAEGLRKYPDPTGDVLLQEIAAFYGLPVECVFAGVGSDDVLAIAFMTFFNSGVPILFPDITYSFYDVWAELFSIPYERPALDADFRIVPQDYRRKNGGIVIANPNAPTGVELSLQEIEEILQANPDVITIVDEAYVDFGAQSALPLIEKYDHLLVVQTTSKSRSLAGLRIGYAMGQAPLIKYLNDVKYSFNSYTLNQPSLLLGAASFKDREYFENTCRTIVETREWTKAQMKELGFSFEDSKANFFFVTHESCSAQELFEALKAEKIYVRHFNASRISNHLRITIGTKSEMNTLLSFLRSYLQKK